MLAAEIIPEVTRKAFKLAQTEKMGACFIEFPENIAQQTTDSAPLPVKQATLPEPAQERVARAAQIISQAKQPIILAGNGVVRTNACKELADFSLSLNIPLANTFMAKGVIPFKHPMALGSAGLQAKDYVNLALTRPTLSFASGMT